MTAIDWTGHLPAPWFCTMHRTTNRGDCPGCDDDLISLSEQDDDFGSVPPNPPRDIPCPSCSGVGAIGHGSGNPELVEDCTRCGGDGTVPSRPAYDGGEAA